MSNGTINKMILIGYVGGDPQFKKTDLFSVCNLSLATTEKGKNGKTTDWHKCVFYNKLAEIVNQYVKKGDKIYVDGKIRTRAYEKNGEMKYITEVLVNEMQILTGKEKSDEPSQSEMETEVSDFDSDIPF